MEKILPVGEKRALQFLDQFCVAMMEMRKKNIGHRDLKPENVLVNHKDELKIVDFGFSVPDVKSDVPNRTIVGTPGF